MQFVWINILGPENGTELKYSIRSVYEHFRGEIKVTVIGDAPHWYTGHHIPVTRIKKRYRRPKDSGEDLANKMAVASQHPEVAAEFTWIQDDYVFLKPVTADDLRVVRYDPWFQMRNNSQWHKLIRLTFDALKARGKPNYQTGTHAPHVFNKQKLADLFALYNFPKALTLFEILYQNHYATEFVPYGSVWEGVEYPYFIKRILNRPLKMADIEQQVAGVMSVNWQENSYSDILRNWLSELFPSASEVELYS